ncbi:uncharacterized protein [Haliotis asinina]|uniref:uncharacterized protein n=1 Tax=Haliotis asinina TaxID=109174 RepID=UPI003531D5D2
MLEDKMNHTEEIPNQNQVKRSVVTASLFKHLRAISCLGGIYRSANPGEKMTRWDILKLVYVICFEIVLLTNIVFYIFATYNYAMDLRPITRLLSFFFVFLICLYLSFVYSTCLSKSFQILYVHCCKYEERYGFSDGFKKWVKKLRAIVVVVSLSIALSTLVKYLLTGVYPNVMNDTFPSSTFIEPGRSVGLSITFLGYMFMEMHWNGNYIIVNILSMLLWQELNRVQTQFKELAKSYREDTESRFNTLVIHFDVITEVLEDISNYVQHSIFTTVFLTLPVTCAIIYSILSNQVTSEELMVYSAGCVWALVCVGFGLFIDALVNLKAHGTLQYVWGLDKERFSGKGLQKVNLFVSRLTGDSIGYNIHGLFTITMPTLLGIVGTLVTYIIVVVQFKPSGATCLCNCFRNVTGSDM